MTLSEQPQVDGVSAFALVDPGDLDIKGVEPVPALVIKVLVESEGFEVATIRTANGATHRVPAGLLIQI